MKYLTSLEKNEPAIWPSYTTGLSNKSYDIKDVMKSELMMRWKADDCDQTHWEGSFCEFLIGHYTSMVWRRLILQVPRKQGLTGGGRVNFHRILISYFFSFSFLYKSPLWYFIIRILHLHNYLWKRRLTDVCFDLCKERKLC